MQNKKAEIEAYLAESIQKQLDKLGSEDYVMLKITIPTQKNQYQSLINHPNVVRVVALSGGYSLEKSE